MIMIEDDQDYIVICKMLKISVEDSLKAIYLTAILFNTTFVKNHKKKG